MSEPTDRQIDAFRRFLAQLPHGKDPELLLLKGHLLIEEQIHALIHRRLRNPEVLSGANARMGCHQAIHLAQAFFPPGHQSEVWQAALGLNKLRNDIAHNLWPHDSLNDKIDAWIQSFPSTFRELPDKKLRFEFTLWSLFAEISTLVDNPIAEIVQLESNGENAT